MDAITWDALKSDSQQIGFLSTVSVALEVVKTIFSGIIDDRIAIFDDLDITPTDKAVAKSIVTRVLDMSDKHAPVPVGFIRADQEITYIGRIANVFKTAFPDPRTLSGRLNKPIESNWFYLNYFLRVVLLIKNYGKTWFMRRHLKEEGVLRRWINGVE